MGFIYCITNQINGKQYIGKTVYSVKSRFKEHCKAKNKRIAEHRPLYSAMNKYGIENFSIEQLLECDNSELSYYEEYYIEKLDTYKNGYNATKGGDGKILFDYDKIIEIYTTQNISMRETAKICGCCEDTVRDIMNNHNIPIRPQASKTIIQLDENSNEIQEFDSIRSATNWILENNYSKICKKRTNQKISDCAHGRIEFAFGFKWKFK